MNERIQELWEQAAKTTQGDSWDEQTRFMERFAELLEKDIEARHFSAGYRAGQSDGITDTVKQCLFLCDQVDLAGADDCIDNIKEHFGVE